MENYIPPPPNNPQGAYNLTSPPQKSNKKIWLLSGIFIGIILIIGLSIFFFLNFKDNFHQGTNSVLKEKSFTFKEGYRQCLPGTNITTSAGDLAQYYQEVLGPQNGLCKIKYKYLKHINPLYDGKEMTCLINSSEEMAPLINCSGSLWAADHPSGKKIGERCEHNEDCKEGLVCLNHWCDEPINECAEDEDCGTCENCENGMEQCFHKSTNNYYGTHYIEQHECGDCSRDSECKEGYICNNIGETHKCVECIISKDCDTIAGEICFNGECKTPKDVLLYYKSLNLGTCNLSDWWRDTPGKPCKNCYGGFYHCVPVYIKGGSPEYYFWVECQKSSYDICKFGYKCENDHCVEK